MSSFYIIISGGNYGTFTTNSDHCFSWHRFAHHNYRIFDSASKECESKKKLVALNKLGTVLQGLIVEAEKFTNFRGEEKKAYVITKASMYALQNKIAFDEVAVGDEIEKIIALSKQVNVKPLATQTASNVGITTDKYNTDKRYSVIYADPPWHYKWGEGKNGGNFAPEKHYSTMTTDEISAMKDVVRKISNKNCALLMWTTMPCLPDVVKVIRDWGFKYKTCAFCWVKVRKDGQPLAGMGSYTKSNVEICLLAMRGHIKSADKTVRQIVMAQRGIHSKKPDEVRNRIVALFGDVPRIELFAREHADGWDCWGNEV